MDSPSPTAAETRAASGPGVLQDRTSQALALGRVDWTFLDSDTRGNTHSIHSYPAKFIPQIPRELIAHLYPRDGSTVLDPFCGSGTTLVEAARAGAPSIGIDLSPLATLIAKVKLTPLRESLRKKAAAVSRGAQVRHHPVPPIPRLDHWFRKDIQRALASIVGEIERVQAPAMADALRVALSSIIVRVSNQESDTRYAAIEKAARAPEVFELFERSAGTIEDALAETWPSSPAGPAPRVRLLNKDILKVTPREVGTDVSLVVTSTPYPNAYEYWLYHKYRMYWLGMDPLAVKEREIGARPHYFRRDPQTEHDFERQMVTCFALLTKVMRPGGFACFLVGRSIIHGRTIDNEAILRRAAEANGFTLSARHGRTIPSTRKAFNPVNSQIREEGLLIFEKPV